MKLEFFSALDTGRVRRNNEDMVLVDPAHGLCLLADGMGGYNAGEVASDMAVQEVHAQLLHWFTTCGSEPGADDIRSALVDAAQTANQKVFDAAVGTPEFRGMGTTLVAALFLGHSAWIGHIGDSRAYLFRAGHLGQISRDHSLLQEQIDAGLITHDEAAFALHRNLVTRAVGVEDIVELEVHEHPLEPGDLLLLCSDGLSDMLPDAVMAQVLAAHENLPAAAAALVEAANAAGGRDNIALILARASLVETSPARAWWPFRR